MTIYLAADHAGFELKEKIKAHFLRSGFTVEDCGAAAFDASDDYPDFIKKAAEAVSRNPEEARGIILGGSGQGEAMAANRYPNVRAAVFYGGPEDIIRLSRAHNDANMLSLGARFLAEDEAMRAVELWLGTAFSKDDRHIRRIKKIER